MKIVTALFKPLKLEEVIEPLNEIRFQDLIITEVKRSAREVVTEFIFDD
jgi:nitrogen regulatory protein PII